MWIDRDRLAMVREFPMHGWTDMHFRRMAVSPLSPYSVFLFLDPTLKDPDIVRVIDAFRM